MTATDNPLIQAMLQPAFYNHPVTRVELIETHISWVLLTGDYAYKLKKPVDFGFLDFSTLAKRKFYCEEELRLNGRLAPDIYLDVIPLAEREGTFSIAGDGKHIIEYAVKMRQFPQQGLIGNLLSEHKIGRDHMLQLADAIAAFHGAVAIADETMPFGEPDQVMEPVEHNFTILEAFITDRALQKQLGRIRQASRNLFQHIRPTLQRRKQQGFIRECHGDLHLGNIAFVNDKPLIFDGIEFNDSLRWIDVMSEIAFLIMDLEDQGEHEFAAAFLNRYLEHSGDYAGLEVLRFYKLYRAMVRAKVTALRLQQEQSDSQAVDADMHRLADYLQLADDYCVTEKPFMIITHGISGSGKSWIGNRLATQLKAIIIHSDYERKRLFGEHRDDLYSHDISNKTYAHLKSTAERLLNTGYRVIVDATFLDASRRKAFLTLADDLGVRFYILHCHADLQLLHQRLVQRSQDHHEMSDADVAVMMNQLEHYQSLDASELPCTISCQSDASLDLAALAEKFQA